MDSEEMETDARQVLMTLTEYGHSAYLVGGCVRDRLLRRKLKDIDIATSALPEEVMGMFPHTAPTGLQHGTVTVIMRNHAFEVTTFRRETVYVQHRRPAKVCFDASLEDDLKRRDFTINAMAIDLSGKLIDPFHGMRDLENGVLRAVGDPSARFAEDALRMMRCLRFAAEYELTVEHNTWQSVLFHGPLLKHIAMERIRSELEGIVEGSFPGRGLKLIIESGLLRYFKIALNLPAASWDSTRVQMFEPLASLPDPDQRWAFFFLVMGADAEQAKSILRKLTFSRKRTLAIWTILSFQEWLFSQMPQNVELEKLWKIGAIRYGKNVLLAWLMSASKFQAAFATDWMEIQLEGFRLLQRQGTVWLEEMPIESIGQLAVSGTDLLAAGNTPGPWVRTVLQRLLEDVALCRLPNSKEVLYNRAINYISEMRIDE